MKNGYVFLAKSIDKNITMCYNVSRDEGFRSMTMTIPESLEWRGKL